MLFENFKSKVLLRCHLEEHRWIDFPLLDLIPDDSIDDITGELIHPEYLLRAQHRLLVDLLAHMGLTGSLCLMPLTRVHDDLTLKQVIIVVEQVLTLHSELD